MWKSFWFICFTNWSHVKPSEHSDVNPDVYDLRTQNRPLGYPHWPRTDPWGTPLHPRADWWKSFMYHLTLVQITNNTSHLSYAIIHDNSEMLGFYFHLPVLQKGVATHSCIIKIARMPGNHQTLFLSHSQSNLRIFGLKHICSHLFAVWVGFSRFNLRVRVIEKVESGVGSLVLLNTIVTVF